MSHIGIASGQVVAGVTGSDKHTEYTMTGDTVSLASRLNDMADPGQTLVSNAVQRATSRITKYASLGDISIKGLVKPVRVWAAVELIFGTHSGTVSGLRWASSRAGAVRCLARRHRNAWRRT